jgi:pimeloyl-ACP methyl ester carboxylesterase
VVRVGPKTGPVGTVLLHGAAGSWTTWTPLLRAASRVGTPLPNIVAVDLPGWGESPTPAGGIDIAPLTDAVRQVAEALGYERWVVVGHSLGGAIALDVAARFPDRTDAVLLVSPLGGAVLDAVRRPIRGGAGLPWFAGMLLAMRVLAALGPLARPLLRGLRRLGALRWLSSPLFADPARVDESVSAALADEIRPASFVAAARAAARYDESVWRGIRCPVRAVRGARDVFVGPDDGDHLATLLADVEETVMQGAGHFAAVEQPGTVGAVLRDLATLTR